MSDFDFATALKAHAEWKTKLRDAITNKETLDEHRIAKDDVCPLGTWLHDKDTTNKFLHLSNYRECKKSTLIFTKKLLKLPKKSIIKTTTKPSKCLQQGQNTQQSALILLYVFIN